MSYRTFVTYSVTGGLAWIWSMLLIGYFLGSRFPGVRPGAPPRRPTRAGCAAS